MKRHFTEWYAKQISDGINAGKDPVDIEVPVQLSVLKPLHAKWIIKLFNEMTSEAGKSVILNGWEKSGITDGIKLGKSKLTTLDPFHDMDPLIGHEEEYDLVKALQNNQDCLSEGLTCVSVTCFVTIFS